MEFRLFGPIEAVDSGGRLVELGTPKQRAVLAMLAVEPGRVVSLDRLIDALWADEAPSSATGTLQAYISNLRKALEPDRAPRTPATVLVTREPGYLLAVAPGQVDLIRFAAWAEDGHRALVHKEYDHALRILGRAVALWRGDPLAEFADQDFAVPVVARLTELRAAAEEDRFEARLALGESTSLVADLERLVELHPHRERRWGLLGLALYRAGRQADALAALRRARELLAGEFGIDPGPDLRRLEQSILEHDPELAAPAPARGSAAGGGSGDDRRLIGREGELARLNARLTELRRGRGGVVLIEGEAGIGKTRLAEAAADEAAGRGMTVGWGRCVDTAPAPAFWPWAQVLREIGAGAEVLTGTAAPGELFELYQRVLAALTASAPLTVVLDDLHWADTASLRLLAFAGGELARHPVLVVATFRSEPGEHPKQLRETLGALVREPSTERIDVGSFTGEDVAAYLRARDADSALAAVLHERSGGNPFYLKELVRLLDSEHSVVAAVPTGVRDVVARRVARLPADSQSLLHVAAVAGRDIDPDLLETVTETPIEQVLSALEPAVATGLLAEAGDGYRFSHALVRDTLYAGLGRIEAGRLHLRIGHAMETLSGGGEPTVLAHHFAKAARVGGRAKAVEHAARAARVATAAHHYDQAVSLWELALAAGDTTSRGWLLTELGRARRAVGDADGARRDLEQALELAQDRDALVAVLSAFGGQSVWVWRPYGVVNERMVAALEELLSGPLADRDRAALLGTLGVELVYGPRRTDGERLAAQGVELARETGDATLIATTLNNYYLAAWAPDTEAERRAATEEILTLPALPRVTELIARVLRMACLLRAGELAEWDRDLARCDRLLEEIGRPELHSMVRIAETARRTLDGDWTAAAALGDRFAAVEYGASLWGPDFPRLITKFGYLREQRRVPSILDELRAASTQMIPLRPVTILAALDCDQPDLARTLIDQWGTDIRDDWAAGYLLAIWGFIAARLGIPDPATMYDRLLPHADQLMTIGMGMSAWGSHHVALADLAHRLGEGPRAIDHAHRALRIHQRLGLTHWEQRSTQQLASLTG